MICCVPHIIHPLKAFILKVVLNRKLCFLQVDDGLTHMLDEVFDERLENISESSARAPKTNN